MLSQRLLEGIGKLSVKHYVKACLQRRCKVRVTGAMLLSAVLLLRKILLTCGKLLEQKSLPMESARSSHFFPGAALFGRLLVLVALPRGAALPARVRVKFVGPQEDSECVLVLQDQILS